MNLVIIRQNLSKVLSIVSRNISSRPQLPILSNILLEAKNNTLIISATNLESGVTCLINAKTKQEGIITVPGKLFTEYISTLTSDKLEMELLNTKLVIKTDKNKASFSTASATDFPSFSSFSKSEKNLPFNKIKQSILRVVFAASTDETRPVLTGVKVIISGKKMKLIATDGYRMSTEEIGLPTTLEDFQAILPAQTLIELVRIATETKEEEVGFSIIQKKNQIVFTLTNINLYSRLIEGEFPNVEKIIPQGFKTKITVQKDDLIQSVKTAALFARGAANIVKIKTEEKGLWLSANTPQIGENQDFVEAKIEGENVETAYNYRFLLDILNNFPGDEVVIETSGPLNPGVFRSVSINQSFLHLIMPVRVQD
ncbi:DNA polymerase III subunit beta [Candidatus Gottesmanbacteria bacterium RBG_13_37_7]|uniref:Beta sliding clamp n=1 Tax=Candidatus Gottesmanbacteria bacterium RBG_13_37_7 TaxID=1798369 RepID=A0A1F5YGH7_9BACT|nr:MAG: DNA polymerase III subunit beta [Candidatus Gottesmanbacteria bacterium RBG_13_37_7]